MRKYETILARATTPEGDSFTFLTSIDPAEWTCGIAGDAPPLPVRIGDTPQAWVAAWTIRFALEAIMYGSIFGTWLWPDEPVYGRPFLEMIEDL